MTERWPLEPSPLGAILVPPLLPASGFLFYTTAAFDGFLTAQSIDRIQSFIRERFGVPSVLSTCEQVHGVNTFQVPAAEVWREYPQCDALFTASKAVALGIKVADCLPVTLADPVHSVLANIHSGWRGSLRGIVPRTMEAMRAGTGFTAAGAIAWLGPSIRVCCFEVGEEVIEQFAAVHPGAERFTNRSVGLKPHFDLPAFTRSLLTAGGFAEDNIHDSGICTRCEPATFHSYRRLGRSGGRNLAIAGQ
ncbi:MAG: peptidoglycan editing factor PgeF [Acidobacteriota bacterium]